MAHQFAEIMFTDGVKAAQEEYGSRTRIERFTANAGPNDELTDREAGFIAQRDTSFDAIRKLSSLREVTKHGTKTKWRGSSAR